MFMRRGWSTNMNGMPRKFYMVIRLLSNSFKNWYTSLSLQSITSLSRVANIAPSYTG
jgi:hypothetical protein